MAQKKQRASKKVLFQNPASSSDLRFKYLNSNRKTNVEVIPGVVNSYTSYQAQVEYSSSLNFKALSESLYYFLTIKPLEPKLYNSIAAMLKLQTPIRRHDIYAALSRRYVEWSLSIAIYMKDRIHDSNWVRRLSLDKGQEVPVLTLKILSLMSFSERRFKKSGSNDYVWLSSGEFEYFKQVDTKDIKKYPKGVRDILSIKNDFELTEYLMALTDVDRLMGLGLCKSFDFSYGEPINNTLLSCIVEDMDDSFCVLMGNELPTELEVVETIIFNIKYKVKGVPRRLLGNDEYIVPKSSLDLGLHVFWNSLLDTDVTSTLRLDSSVVVQQKTLETQKIAVAQPIELGSSTNENSVSASGGLFSPQVSDYEMVEERPVPGRKDPPSG